jgi:PAS domain S-box-containing protein
MTGAGFITAMPNNHDLSVPDNEHPDYTRMSGMPFHAMDNSPSEEALRQIEQRHHHLIERCTDGIFLVRQARIVGTNQAAARMLGYASAEQLNGRALADILQSGDTTGQQARELAVPLNECPARFDKKLRLSDGSIIDAEITVSPYLDADAPDGHLVVIQDVSVRKRLTNALYQHDRYVRTLTDTLPVLIAQCDRNYRLGFINKTFAERFGHSHDNVIGKCISEIFGEQAFADERPYLDAALSGKPQEHEVKMPSPQGGERYMHIMYVPEFDERGAVQGLIAAISDTTQLRDAEERLQRREREFKTLVENSPDIISRIDRDMRHLYVNPAIKKLAGWPASDYLGKTKAELGLPHAVVSAWDDAARAAFETGMEQKLDFDHVLDGQMRYFSGRVIPEIDRYGNIESVVGIAYDVTERATVEKERDDLLARERAARIQAETAARARDEFLAIVSHELRAPLNAIQSWAHVLENYVKEASTAPLAQRALQGIKTGVGQQVRLIEDLLDVTRMMSGKLRLVKQPLALLPALQASVESVHAMSTAKNISITCTYRITSEQIEGDADRVQQIFWNLLSNAIKFTQAGGNVWLNASHADQEICVTVRDDGIGISPDFLPQLFNRFSQEDTSSTRDHSGLGLGLFLVRHLVELHGGQVKAESQGEGKGTVFSVYFPLRVRSDKYLTVDSSEEGSAGSLLLPSLAGLHILLIDDQEEARESLKVVLTNAGASVFAAASATEALAWLPTLDAADFPGVLVCDIAMPGEDGYSVLRKIRAWKSADGSTPLLRMPALALTAFAQREDRIRALTAGFQMHVTKPVAPEELIVVIDTMATRA